jgi:hypothetical protein
MPILPKNILAVAPAGPAPIIQIEVFIFWGCIACYQLLANKQRYLRTAAIFLYP